MKKTTGGNIIKVAVAVVIFCTLGILGYRHGVSNRFAEDWKQMQVLGMAEADTYEIDLKDAHGVRALSDAENKKHLLQLIVSVVQEGEKKEMPDESTPALGIRITEKEGDFKAMLWVYDFGEETDIGLFQTENGTYCVKNCGEVLNYLAELGCVTER